MKKQNTFIIFLILISIVAFFFEIYIQGKGFFLGDNLLAIVPHKIFVLENLKKGLFPLWNPHQWAGFPELGDVTFGLFNPFSLIHFIFPDMSGINVIALIAYFLSFYGTFLFLKNEGLKSTSAFLGGLIFSFCGSMINISADVIRLESICFLPWIGLFARKEKMSLTILFLILSFLVGQTQHFYMSVFFVFLFLISHGFINKNYKSVLKFLISLLSSILLSSFMIFPQIELLELSSRANAGDSYNTIWSLHPLSFIRFIFANFWGRHNEGSFWGPDVTYSFGYVGFFTLIVIMFNLNKLTKKSLFFLLLSIFTLLIALGKYNPLHGLFSLIPGFSLFRNPTSWLIIYSFSTACLLSLIVDNVNFFNQRTLRKILLLTGSVFLFFSLIILIINLFNFGFFFEFLKTFAGIIGKSLSGFHNEKIDAGIALLIGHNLFVLGLLSFIFAKFFNLKTLIFIVFIDLMFFAKSDLSVSGDVNNTFAKTRQSPVISFLKKNIGSYRFLSTSEFTPVRGMSIYMTDYFRRPPFLKNDFWSLNSEEIKKPDKYWKELQLLPPDIYVAYEISSINGYAGFYLKSFASYFKNPSNQLSSSAKRVMELREENKDPIDPSRINFNYVSLDDPRLDELGVKYILARERLKLSHHKEIYLGDDFFIYENKWVKPRAEIIRISGKKTTTPEIYDLSPNSVRIDFKNYIYQKGDYLLVRDTYYPGWLANDQNNQRLEVYEKNIFRKVELNDDIKSVTLKYQPVSFYSGLLVSAATLAILILWSIFKRYLKNK